MFQAVSLAVTGDVGIELTDETLCLVLGPQRLGNLTSQVCVEPYFETEADLAKSVAFGALGAREWRGCGHSCVKSVKTKH